MLKRMLCAGMTLLLVVFSAGSICAANLDISAPSAILIEASTGQTLYESNAHERLQPASVTKIMTLLLVMEALDDGRITWDDTVTTSAAAAAKGGSQVYLEENEQMSMTDMIKSVVVSSANDCATALAEHIAGSESAFVEMMNQRAAELGMTDTHFVNCTGLDDDPDAAEHLTTAYDIALMSRELLKHERIKEFTTIWMDTVRGGQFGLSNTNKLIRFYDGATGLKTGFTKAAGHCLSASAKRNGMELIAVVLHCSDSTSRFESAKAMLNYGFSNYALVQPTPSEPIGSIPVVLGTQESITPVPADQTPILVDKALAAGVTCTVELAESVTAPIEQGQTLGTMTVTSNGQTLSSIPMVAAEAVAQLRWWDVFQSMLRAVCMS